MRRIVISLSALVHVAIGVACCCGNMPTKQQLAETRAEIDGKVEADAKISRNSYNSISRGMSYKQVVQVLGREGQEQSSIGALQTFTWSNGRCTIRITFDGGFVEAKSIAGD